MTCTRQLHGMPDNCAICKALQPTFYGSCRGEPDKVKPPIKRPQPEIMIVRELSYEEAKEEVVKYIQSKSGKFHISEISEKLGIDVEMVVKIVEGL